MESELARFGVSVVAISKDTVEDAAFHRRRDGLKLPLLSDSKLEIIGRYGLVHTGALEFSTGRFSIGEVPIALLPSFKTMAIPTTLLVDENGVIQWIDQSDDYRLRSHPERVLGAVKEAFGDHDGS